MQKGCLICGLKYKLGNDSFNVIEEDRKIRFLLASIKSSSCYVSIISFWKSKLGRQPKLCHVIL
jgi:hypothetical protein